MASDLGVSISVSAAVGGAVSDLASVSKAMKTLASTHSRAKAAGQPRASSPGRNRGFNTQPREGGWIAYIIAGRNAEYNSLLPRLLNHIFS